MGEPRREAPEGGEVVRPPQDVPVLVQRPVHPAEGGHGVLELRGHRRRPPRNDRRSGQLAHASLSTPEDVMHRYEQVSGVFFLLVALAQLARLLLRWPVQVASVSVPLWASAVAVLITASLAAWAFRAASTPSSTDVRHAG